MKAITIHHEGAPCPRCSRPMERREHPPGWKPPTTKCWYEFWYRCAYDNCKTKEVMPVEAMRQPAPEAPSPLADLERKVAEQDRVIEGMRRELSALRGRVDSVLGAVDQMSLRRA